MATPTTGTLLNNHFDSLTSFFIEIGNMVITLKNVGRKQILIKRQIT